MNCYNRLAPRHTANDWCESYPSPTARVCLYICLSSPSLPMSLPLWCYLWVCVSVGRRWRSVWPNPDKDKLISQQTQRERGGRGDKTKQTKERMPKLYSNTKQWGSCWIQAPLFLPTLCSNTNRQTPHTHKILSESLGSAGAPAFHPCTGTVVFRTMGMVKHRHQLIPDSQIISHFT